MHSLRQIVRSPQAASRVAHARSWLEAQKPDTEVLLLAANWESADDLVRAVAAGRGALLGVHRLTLNRLIGLLAANDLAARGLVPLSTLATEAVAARAIHGLYSRLDSSPSQPHFDAPDPDTLSLTLSHRKMGEGTETDFFAAVAARPGFPGAVAQTAQQLRMAGIDPAALAAAGRSGSALAAILERFEHELASASLIDRAGMIQLAIAAAASRPRFVGLPTLLLDLPVTSAMERDLLGALAVHSPAILATVPAGDHRTQRYLAQALAVEPQTLPPPDATRSSLHLLQEHLFETSAPPRCALDDSVAIFSAPGESRECVEIVRAIQARAERGVPFDQIAVLLHAPGQYLPHLQEALRRADIPAYYCAGTRRPEPGGRALLALLACAAEKLSAHRFGEYLSLAQVPNWDAAGKAGEPFVAPDPELTPAGLGAELEVPHAADEPPTYLTDPAPTVEGTVRAPWRWEDLIVEASVIGSRDRWRRRLDGLREELVRKRAEVTREDAGAARLDRQLLDLDHLSEVALAIIDVLASLPGKATWGDWLGHLRALTAMAVRDATPVLAVLAELEPMAPVGPIDLEEVRIVLSNRLGTLTERPPRRRYGAVFVGLASAARGLCFDVVLVPALSERLFPRKVVEDPILPDESRRLISADLELQPERVAAERLTLRLAVGAARHQLYLSYPRLDIEQGRPRVPSFYALETLRAAEGYLPGFHELAERAAAAQELRLGWPAPDDEQAAIDHAEFDLGLLQRLLDADPDTTTGAAHYLLNANTHLARALRARGRRWLRRWTPADGLVDPDPAAVAALARHQLTARSYSATALQHYAECPYRFFLQAIHRLEPREEPEAIEVIDPLTRGSLFHEVQFDLLSALRERGMLPVTSGNLEAAQNLVDERLNDRADDYHDQLAPAIERVWDDGIAAIRADLREWLRRMAEDAHGWCPERFELSFGLADREQADPASSADPVALEAGLKLRGSIDLVERHRDGALRVTDHKTGKVRAQSGVVVGGGKILQPVLYALAAEKLLHQEVAAGRLYYCTSAGGYEDRVVELSRKLQNGAGQATNKTAREVARDVVGVIGAALAEGFFPAAPASRECNWCDYKMVCGPHEELRIKRKPAARLKSLGQLREMP
ncbi:MAG TPA: PD-(D/E)XK nuclease family protein [Candidatus Binataceae bacterium]|nr:PD-(D/E)XK nuclease family protein [Candidatus Binataceae bacterium]